LSLASLRLGRANKLIILGQQSHNSVAVSAYASGATGVA
jgi:hypothetical protein